MIVLDDVTLHGSGANGTVSVLNRVSVTLPPGIVHIEADQALERNRFIDLLAGRARPREGMVTALGRVSWPLGDVGPFWSKLTGYQTIDFLCSVFHLDRSDAFRFFRDIMDEPAWLNRGVDTWSRTAMTQFLLAGFIAPQFDVYLLRTTPVVPQRAFFDRWKPLFLERTAGKTVVMATGHRAARAAFPGDVFRLRAGKLYREAMTVGSA